MKKAIFIFSLFTFHFSLFTFLVSCQREEELPEATSAAKEIYLQYADRKDLTVALIGDYQGYNAVMLQAQDNEGWLRLCEEFGVKPLMDASALDTVKVSGLTRSSILIDNFDGTPGEAVTRLLDSLLNVASQSGVNSGQLVATRVDTIRIDTLPTVTHRESYAQGVLVDSSTTVGEDTIPVSDRLMQTARNHGNIGYLIHDDSDNLTLWLFFYSNMEEFSQIIDNISINNTIQ